VTIAGVAIAVIVVGIMVVGTFSGKFFANRDEPVAQAPNPTGLTTNSPPLTTNTPPHDPPHTPPPSPEPILMTMDESRDVLQTWLITHPFLLYSDIASGSDELMIDGKPFQRFRLQITRYGTVEVLVDRNTGDLIHYHSPSHDQIESLDDWYNREHFGYIEAPIIVITTRYNSNTGRFVNQDEYAEAVRSAGGIPMLPDNDSMLADALRTGDISNVDAIAALYDGLILPGGGDISASFFGQVPHPLSGTPDVNLDRVEIALCQAFINAGKPVLGVNRGMQVLNVAMGGDIIQDIPDLLGIPSNVHSGSNTHIINIVPDSWLYELFDRSSSLLTYSSHHQSVGRIADGFVIAAYIDEVVEAIENGNALGVQFQTRPDRLPGDYSSRLYMDFIKRCSRIPIR
jgi:gamma-glutamyl-gamma-aminobutyrate hydrolase PuuD